MSNKDTHMKSIRSLPEKKPIPVICIVGYSGTGKTTIIVQLIAVMKRYGLRVGTVKHDTHGFEIDKPGKDSYRHKEAGAFASVITSPKQIAMVSDADHDHSPEELLPLLPALDIVLAEGFKRAKLPKIEIYRPETGKGPACMEDPDLIAVISDSQLDWGVPQFSTSDIEGIVTFILQQCRISIAEDNFPEKSSQSGS